MREWIKNGKCINKGEYNCDLGYSCDSCPYNYSYLMLVSKPVKETLTEEEIDKMLEDVFKEEK